MNPTAILRSLLACLLTICTAVSCTMLRTSEQINEIGTVHYIRGKPEGDCVWKIGGQYYLKCPVIPYKRHPGMFNFIAAGCYTPSSYTRICDIPVSYEYVLIGPYSADSKQVKNKSGDSPQALLDAFSKKHASYESGYKYAFVPEQLDLKKARKHTVSFPVPAYNVFSEGFYDLGHPKNSDYSAEIVWVTPPDYFENNDNCFEIPTHDTRSFTQKTFSKLSKILIDTPSGIVLTLPGLLFLSLQNM